MVQCKKDKCQGICGLSEYLDTKYKGCVNVVVVKENEDDVDNLIKPTDSISNVLWL